MNELCECGHSTELHQTIHGDEFDGSPLYNTGGCRDPLCTCTALTFRQPEQSLRTEVERLTRERDEWKRLEEAAEARRCEQALGTKQLLESHDALAVQNNALRETLEVIRISARTTPIASQETLALYADEALALDLPRAAKIYSDLRQENLELKKNLGL